MASLSNIIAKCDPPLAASDYLSLVTDYITRISTSKHIFNPPELTELQLKFEDLSHYAVEFYEDYGCLLLLTKKKAFTKTSVGILFLSKMSTNTMTSQSQQIYYVQDPEEVGYFELGELNNHQELEDDLDQIITKIAAKRNQMSNEQKRQQSPYFFKTVVELSLKQLINDKKVYLQPLQKNVPVSNPKKELKIDIISNHSTNFRNINTYNMSQSLSYLFFAHCFKNQQLAKTLLLGFKIDYLFELIMDDLEEADRQQLNAAKECLECLIVGYKTLYNTHIQMNNELAKQLFSELDEMIKARWYDKFEQPSIITKETIKISLQEQNQYLKPQSIARLVDWGSKKNPQLLLFANSIGFDKKLIINGNEPFTNLLQRYNDLKSTEHVFYWIQMVESTFFRLADTLTQPWIKVEEIYVNFRNQFSKLHQVIKKYQQLMTVAIVNKQYSFKLKNQAYSHVYLIKSIAAVLAFEVVRDLKEESDFSIDEYRIDLQVEKLYNKFTSVSHDARVALQNLAVYSHKNSNKGTIFSLNHDCKENSELRKYAQRQYEGKQSLKKCLLAKKQKLANDIKELNDKFLNYKQRYSTVVKLISQAQTRKCTCPQIQPKKQSIFANFGTSNKCNRCSDKQRFQNQLEFLKKQQFNVIHAQFPYQPAEQYLMIFLQNIGKDIAGLMKLVYQSQIPITNKQAFQKNCHRTKDIEDLYPITPFTDPRQQTRRYFYQETIERNENANRFVVYMNSIQLYYYNYCQRTPLNSLFLQEESDSNNPFQWIISIPNNSISMARQHMVYANLDKKHTTRPKIPSLDQMSSAQFIEYASIRITSQTELLMLTQGILSRQITLSTLKPHLMQMQIILNSTGNIKAFKSWQKQLPTQPKPIIFQSILQLLDKYLHQWRFQDIYSLMILGVVFSVLSKLIDKTNLTMQIAQRAYQQYSKLKKQNAMSSSANAKLRQLYLLHSIMSCFTENLCEDSNDACILFAKIMVNSRVNRRFLSNPLNKSQYVNVINAYKNYFDRAVYVNIHSVVAYFQENPNQLTNVVQEVDKDINHGSEWQFSEGKNYVFNTCTPAEKNSYQINLFEGIILKNGTETTRIPENIKNHEEYIKIFGKSDLEVFSQADGSIRTRANFSTFFPQEKQTVVLFEFNLQKYNSETIVIIKMIFKKQGSEKSYLLIPHSQLRKCQIFIPELYLNQYQCWLDEARHNLIFRMRNIKTIKGVGLVLMCQPSQLFRYQIGQGRIITKQFQNQSMDFLTSHLHQNYFEKLMIIDKNHIMNQAISILSSVELPRYILQLYSKDLRPKTLFWLHRFGLKFAFDEQNGLISQNYQGYTISESFKHHQLLPWSPNDHVNCLVLSKYQHNLRTAGLHQYLMLLPNQNILKQGKINIIEGQTLASNMFSYQVHDNFQDLRSKSRVQQMHLMCLIASLNSKFRFRHLMLTNEQYCVSLSRSCLSNLPLSHQQSIKMLNLIQLCIELDLNILLLCCQVMCKLSQQLANILPFKNINNSFYCKHVRPFLESKQELINTCKTIYRKRYIQQTISPHQKLNQLELTLLHIDEDIIGEMDRKIKRTEWCRKESFQFKIDPKIANSLDSISQKFQKTQNDIQHLKETIYKFFDKQEQTDNPQDIDSIIRLRLDDCMSKQMSSDLKDSYSSFIRYNEKYEKISLTKEESIKQIRNYFTLPKNKCESMRNDLVKYLTKLTSNQEHLDFIIGNSIHATPKDYAQILCRENKIYEFYTQISNQTIKLYKKTIRQWILLTLEIQSLHRILMLLKETSIDKTALFRQLESPRKQISKKDYWICFEAEMKIRIWLSQYDTYKHLRNSQSGSVSQLNMGEGKTQVIIPMIVLDNIYDGSFGYPISRINVLSSLFQQAQNNYFKFFSTTSFKIPIFSFYFNRDVQVTRQSVNSLKYMLHLMKSKMMMLMDRESCLSMVLKIRECYLDEDDCYIKEITKNRDEWMFGQDQIYDIFDEVDALMTIKKSFVYSIGGSSELPEERIRFEMARVVMEIITKQLFPWLIKKQMIIIEETLECSLESIDCGSYPKNLRLVKGLPRDQIMEFRYRIIESLLLDINYRPAQYKFFEVLQESQKQILIKYLTDQTFSEIAQIEKSLPNNINQILIIRGLVAYGVVEHCLKMRNGVQFGSPSQQHMKTVAVPYEAADIPSLRSQFSHPDVAILLSYIAYFNKGLSYVQFRQALFNLMEKTQSAKKHQYCLWIETILKKQFKPTQILEVKQINIDSDNQIQLLFEKFKCNRSTIIYWLINCVFVNDLRQFKQSITSSAHDISQVTKSIAFSGTKDSRWLFPNYLDWKPSENDAINGTDGKMVHSMLFHTKGVITLEEGDSYLWQRFCQSVLQIKDKDVGSIIDAGAILAGKSLKEEIIPWIMKNPLFDRNKFKGISFCDQGGKWRVYDTVTHITIDRGAGIPEHQTFVIFDEARTRGADIKMNSNVKAVLSLSPAITKDKLMQAVGRLRKFGRNQQIYIIGTHEIFSKIKGIQVKQLKEKVSKIIQWACLNSLEQNRYFLLQNSRLAQIHYKTIYELKPDIQKFDPSLHHLYSGKVTQNSVYQIFKVAVRSKLSQQQINSREIQVLSNKMKSYGSDYMMISSDLNEVCERQANIEDQAQEIRQKEHMGLVPYQQTNDIVPFNGPISSMDFKLDQRLKFSTNFIKCTKSRGLFFSLPSTEDNQLSNINFILWEGNRIIIITQLEMQRSITKGTRALGCFQLKKLKDYQQKFVARFRDLDKDSDFVKDNQLQGALAHAQFFNGIETFDQVGQRIIFELAKREYQSQQQRMLLLSPNGKSMIDIEKIVTYFLIRRRTLGSKFVDSVLEQILVQMKSISDRQLSQIR